MVGCSRMWCPAAAGLAAVGVGLVVVEGKCPCLDGGAVVVGYGEKIGLDGGLLVPGDVVGSSQHTVGAVGIGDGVAVLVGGKKLVVDMVVGPVVEEDQPDLGGAMMVVPVEVQLGLGGDIEMVFGVVGNPGDVGVEEEELGVEEEELVDMDGTCLGEAKQEEPELGIAVGAWCCDAGM